MNHQLQQLLDFGLKCMGLFHDMGFDKVENDALQIGMAPSVSRAAWLSEQAVGFFGGKPLSIQLAAKRTVVFVPVIEIGAIKAAAELFSALSM